MCCCMQVPPSAFRGQGAPVLTQQIAADPMLRGPTRAALQALTKGVACRVHACARPVIVAPPLLPRRPSSVGLDVQVVLGVVWALAGVQGAVHREDDGLGLPRMVQLLQGAGQKEVEGWPPRHHDRLSRHAAGEAVLISRAWHSQAKLLCSLRGCFQGLHNGCLL